MGIIRTGELPLNTSQLPNCQFTAIPLSFFLEKKKEAKKTRFAAAASLPNKNGRCCAVRAQTCKTDAWPQSVLLRTRPRTAAPHLLVFVRKPSQRRPQSDYFLHCYFIMKQQGKEKFPDNFLIISSKFPAHFLYHAEGGIRPFHHSPIRPFVHSSH